MIQKCNTTTDQKKRTYYIFCAAAYFKDNFLASFIRASHTLTEIYTQAENERFFSRMIVTGTLTHFQNTTDL